MSLVQELQQAHKERRARLMNPPKIIPIVQSDEPMAAPFSNVVELAAPIHRFDQVFQKFPSLADVMKSVCEFYETDRVDLFSARRDAPTVKVRHVYFYMTRELTTRSLPEIGRSCGDKDHTTVLHGHLKIKRKVTMPGCDADHRLADEVELLRIKIGAMMMARRLPAIAYIGA